jgi:peptidoglycan biosynthesis protein MviN/MurJ (putative lipid II flippase)
VVEQKPVNVNWQTLFCVLPYIWIYAFYRIEKLRMGIVIAIVTIVASVAVSMIFPFPYGLVGNLVISIGIPIYFIRQWSREWNQRVSHTT